MNEGLTVLSWHEKLPQDEIPPRHIWWSGDLIEKWFRDVEKKRKAKTSGKKSAYDSADEVPMMGNQMTAEDDI